MANIDQLTSSQIAAGVAAGDFLSLIHISEPTRRS